MFGYVVPNQAALSDEAQKRYRTAYCGLCRRIDALHGLRGRFTTGAPSTPWAVWNGGRPPPPITVQI